MTRRISALAVALVLLAAPLLAACGSGSGAANASGGSSATTRQQTSATTVKTASVGGLGTILVDADGRAIYLFQRDTGPTSTCTGACLENWPAVTTHGTPQAAGDAAAGKLGVSERDDGTTQVTYAGHPLYYYAGDAATGEANGQGLTFFGAPWYVMSPSGSAITSAASSGGSTRGY